jgi:nicotinamidase-related amidase
VVTVLEECCASGSIEDHDAAIRTLQRFCAFTTSDAVDFSA